MSEAKMVPIVFLHGWGVSSKEMQPLASLMKQEGFTIYTPDFPGFGDTPEPSEPWGVDGYVEWFQQFLKKQGIDRCTIFAHSFGGRVAIKLAAKNPKRIKKLILCGAAGIRPHLTPKTAVLFVASKVGKALPKTIQKAAEKQFGHLDVFKVDGIMRETMKKVVQEDLRSYLKHVEMPTLLLWGKDDLLTPPRDGQIMNASIPNSKLVIIQNEGHAVYRTNPERVKNEMMKFL
jgi:pimeloyl-ACP methyl ester carboxylesterase